MRDKPVSIHSLLLFSKPLEYLASVFSTCFFDPVPVSVTLANILTGIGYWRVIPTNPAATWVFTWFLTLSSLGSPHVPINRADLGWFSQKVTPVSLSGLRLLVSTSKHPFKKARRKRVERERERDKEREMKTEKNFWGLHWHNIKKQHYWPFKVVFTENNQFERIIVWK